MDLRYGKLKPVPFEEMFSDDSRAFGIRRCPGAFGHKDLLKHLYDGSYSFPKKNTSGETISRIEEM